jgi:hypothetical protein
MSDWIVKDAERGSTRPVDSRAEAEEVADELRSLGADVEIIPPGEGENQTASADGGPDVVETQPDESPTEAIEADTDGYDLPDDGPSVDEDPLVWMPDEFTDQIDGSVAINRKGFEVLAHHYDIQCRTELVETLTTEVSVVMKAVATDADGDEYSAFGSASKERGDDAGLLIEMADTRAYKRAISRATGVVMVAVSELQNEL